MAAHKWQTVRVFISSTFRDMHAERDHLVKVVFPALRERLEEHRIHLVDIDLRWGITEEESRHDRVLDLCLQQIDECRPFFVGILGERYGWVPKTFHEEAASKYGWVQYHTGKSVTELEILYGVLRDPKMRDHGLFFIRDPAFIRELPEAKRADFTAEDDESAGKLAALKEAIRGANLPHPPLANYPCRYAGLRINWRLVRRELAEADRQALEEIARDGIVDREESARLDERLRGLVLRYGTVHLAGLEAFGREVGKQLWEAIKKVEDLPDTPPAESRLDPLAEELDYHERFMESRLRVYAGRQGVQDKLVAFADDDATTPCLVTGPSGSGKSAALARFARWYAEHRPDVLLIPHFVGASPGSTSLRRMLKRFCLELSREFLDEQKAARLAAITGQDEEARRQREAIEKEYEVPEETNSLVAKLRQFLEKVPQDKRVVFVVDALNQLDESDDAHSLHWLPAQSPQQVKIVVSCIDDSPEGQPPTEAVLQAFANRSLDRLRIEPLTGEERLEIVSQVPSLSAKKLDSTQIGLLLSNPATTNPLFLLVALEELRGFGSYEQLAARIAAFPHAGDTVTAIFGQVIDRLCEEFDADTVRTVLALLACARSGMAERELLEMIEGAGVEESAGDLFPVLRQLRPYLQHRGELTDFFHRGLYKAVRERYLPDQESLRRHHHDLAAYFRAKADPASNGLWSGQYTRGWSELAFHMFHARRTSELRELLMTYLWIRGRLRATDVQALIGDYDLLKPGRNEPVGLVQGALRLSAHVLSHERRELPTQVTGRLLGLERPELEQLLLQVRQDEREPWLWPKGASLIQAGGPLVQTLKGHRDEVNVVAVTADGNRAVSASLDGTLRLWDLESSRELRTMEGHKKIVWRARSPHGHYSDFTIVPFVTADGRQFCGTADGEGSCGRYIALNLTVFALAVTADGKRAVSGSEDKMLTVWDLESGRELLILEGHVDSIRAVAVTADGKRAVSGSDDKTLKVWDLECGRELLMLEGHADRIRAVAVTADGKRAVSGSDDKTLRVWDLESGRVLRTLEWGAAEFNVVTPTEDLEGNLLKILQDMREGQDRPEKLQKPITDQVLAVALTADGKRVVSASCDGTLKVWDLESGRLVRTLDKNTALVRATWMSYRADVVALAVDGNRAVSGSGDNTLKVRDLESGRVLRMLEGHTDDVRAAVVTPDGRRAVSGSRDKTLRVWDLDCLQLPEGETDRFWAAAEAAMTLANHVDGIQAVAVTPDGKRAVCGSQNYVLKIWDLTSGLALRTMAGHEFSVLAVAVTADGKRAVSASRDHTLRIWDLESGRELRTLRGHSDWVNAVAVTADGKRAVSASRDHTLKIWDLESGQELRTLSGHGICVNAVAVTTDGKQAISASQDNTLKVWDLESGRELRTLRGHSGWVNAVAVTADGKRAVSASQDHTLKIWDLESGQELRTLAGHTAAVNAVVVTADGKRAISASQDNTLKVWEVESGRRIAQCTGDCSFFSCRVVPDGNEVVVGDEAGRVHLLRLESFPGPNAQDEGGVYAGGSISQLAPSPDPTVPDELAAGTYPPRTEGPRLPGANAMAEHSALPGLPTSCSGIRPLVACLLRRPRRWLLDAGQAVWSGVRSILTHLLRQPRRSLLDARQTIEALGVDEYRLQALVAKGELRVYRYNTRLVFRADEVAALKATLVALAQVYVASRMSEVFHRADCGSILTVSEENRVTYANREEAVRDGKRPCEACKP